MSILLSLTFLFIVMITFCKKSVNTFLGLANSKLNGTVESPTHCRNIPSLASGLAFVTFPGNTRPPTNVVESATANSPPPSSSTTAPTTDAVAGPTKRDPGGIGFLDDVGGSVDGLMSCTESLGFESLDERRINDGVEDADSNHGKRTTTSKVRSMWKKTVPKNREKKFQPPLSSLNHNGKPTFFLRPVRKDGRLELMEVKIDRPEILRASRGDGRLRLHLIRDDDADVQEQAEEQEHLEQEEEVINEKVEKEERGGGEWWFPATGGGGDGFRRCNELVSHHHSHQNLHRWSQHCVTIG